MVEAKRSKAKWSDSYSIPEPNSVHFSMPISILQIHYNIHLAQLNNELITVTKGNLNEKQPKRGHTVWLILFPFWGHREYPLILFWVICKVVVTCIDLDPLFPFRSNNVLHTLVVASFYRRPPPSESPLLCQGVGVQGEVVKGAEGGGGWHAHRFGRVHVWRPKRGLFPFLCKEALEDESKVAHGLVSHIMTTIANTI